MPKFKIEKKESKVTKLVTFDKSQDYQAVTLLTKDKEGKEIEGKTTLLHKVQAEKLISEGKAKKATASVTEITPVVSKKLVKKEGQK